MLNELKSTESFTWRPKIQQLLHFSSNHSAISIHTAFRSGNAFSLFFFTLHTIYTVLYVFWPFIKSCILSRNPLLSIHVFSKYSFLFLIICKLHMQTFCLMLIVVCFTAVYFVGLFCAKKMHLMKMIYKNRLSLKATKCLNALASYENDKLHVLYLSLSCAY